MSTQYQIENATVLNREIRGENSLYIEAFSENLGLVRMMKRVSSKKTTQMPDIFDDISATAEADSPSALKFLRDFDIIKSRTAIAANYDCYAQASYIAQCSLKNGAEIEDSAKFSERLRTALDALEIHLPPSCVRIKFLYLISRSEGYPVKEDFFEKLTMPQKNLFATIVKTPTSELKEFESRAADMLETFCNWIESYTDIIP